MEPLRLRRIVLFPVVAESKKAKKAVTKKAA
jgi:hypothetical protein